MRRKKKSKGILKYLILLVCVLIVVYGSMFSVAFTLTGSSNGDKYYDGRCIDTSSYESSGYSLDHIDEEGCRVVKKRIISYSVQGSYGGTGCYQNSYTGSDSRYCPSGLTGCGCINDYKNKCCAYSYDYKGGYEQVENTCEYDQNDLLGGETFAGPQAITKLSTRYPVKAFCKAHPAIFTNDELKKSITSTSVYDDLMNGRLVTVDSKETLTLFYVLENNHNLPTICDSEDNLAVNLDNDQACLSTLGFSYFCSEGQFDALTGTCVIQGATVCEAGYRYDTELDACIRNPPHQVDCEDNSCYYSTDREVCICYPEEEFTCASGFELSEPKTKKECQAIGGTWDLCPQCPADKVCPEGVCIPRCSKGQTCVWESHLVEICEDENATIRNGKCEIDGEEIIICPEGYNYNKKSEYCEKTAESRLVCDDGSQPSKDQITGNMVCPQVLPTYINCEPDELYDPIKKRCVSQMSVYDPDTEQVVIYKEIQKMCESNDDCASIDGSLVCNKDRGVCHSDIRALNADVIKAKQALDKVKKQAIGGVIAALIIYIILIALLVKNKPKRKRR